ncbi:MAG TPA: TatD family hydrolase [Nitrospiria bacterium]|nr:TatD family hydrolase [Nitrospiria bacterium]
MLIDTHCHIEMLGNEIERTEAIKRAREAGVAAMVSIGTDLSSSETASKLAMDHPDIFATVGVHPHDAKTAGPEVYDRFRELIRTNPRIRGIGETGLDYYYDHSPREIQRKVFAEHISLAKETELPLVIHSRNAPEETLEILLKEEAWSAMGIFHCFSETEEVALKAMDLGFYISFSGIITFKKAEALQAVVSKVPLERILVETDAPFLSPVPFRGKKNEPAFVRLVAEKIAEIKNIPLEEVMAQTSRNARIIFGIS